MKIRIFKALLLMQFDVFIYSLSTVCGKNAGAHEALSAGFIMWFALDIALMGVYALIWQQVIKVLDLSTAYANKAVNLLWTSLFSAVLFKQHVNLWQLFGIMLVIGGTVIMNTGQGEQEKDRKELQKS